MRFVRLTQNGQQFLRSEVLPILDGVYNLVKEVLYQRDALARPVGVYVRESLRIDERLDVISNVDIKEFQFGLSEP